MRNKDDKERGHASLRHQRSHTHRVYRIQHHHIRRRTSRAGRHSLRHRDYADGTRCGLDVHFDIPLHHGRLPVEKGEMLPGEAVEATK